MLKSHKTFEGQTRFWEHDSNETKTKMKFSTYTPPGELRGCLVWLSGLTCTDENFMAKAGAQKYLAETGMMVICPDTSPRGLNLPGEHDRWSFGLGAGFYVDATTTGYKDHYRMDSYITSELHEIIQTEFGIGDQISISGHSMGGHGALALGLRNPNKYKSISAFSPIVNPMQAQWGQQAFTGYLGEHQEFWKDYDACELLKSGNSHPRSILIDQGSEDEYLFKQLLTDNFVQAAHASKQKAEVRYQKGYDHSYYFISTFIEDHIRFHSEFL